VVSLSVQDLVFDLATRISRRRVAEDILAELRDRIPTYERLSPSVAGTEVLDACAENLRRWMRWLATGQPPAGDDLDALRAAVHSRASEGVPLEDLLKACRVGGRVGLEALRRHSGADHAEILLDAATLMVEYVDLLSSLVTEAYLTQRERLVAEEERPWRQLVDAIVAGDLDDGDEQRLAAHLGVPLHAAYTPFAVTILGGSAARHGALSGRLRTNGVAIAVTTGDRVFGLASGAVCERHLDEERPTLIAMGAPTPRAELAQAREDVEHLVELGRRAGMEGVVSRDERLIELLLARSPRLAGALRERVMAPLHGADQADLVRTLETLVACAFDRASTSRALHVHRNTLAYRIHRIQQLTGLDLGRPRDIASVYLALTADRGPRPG
jgi:hypothetical protein